VDGVDRLDDGARLDAFCHLRPALAVMALLAQVDGTGLPRERLPGTQSRWRYGRKTRLGLERMQALPPWRCRDEAVRPRVGVQAQQVRQGIGQRGAPTRQGARPPGPLGPETLAKPLVRLHGRALEAGCKGASRAWATAGVLGATVTGLAAGTARETPARATGWGPGPRPVRSEEKRGRGPASAVTGYGGTVLLLLEAVPTMPRAVQVGPLQAHASRSVRALVTPARTNLASHARRHTVVCASGVGDGPERGWLDQPGSLVVVPAHATMAVTADARAQAAVRAGLTVRHGQGKPARTERLETAGGGIPGLTTDDHSGTAEPGRHHNRRHFPAPSRKAVVGRHGEGRAEGPGGNPVFLPHAPVATPVRPCDDEDDRRLLEPCGLQAPTPQGALGHSPQTQDRAVRGQVLCP
jgi:hypothetical protein